MSDTISNSINEVLNIPHIKNANYKNKKNFKAIDAKHKGKFNKDSMSNIKVDVEMITSLSLWNAGIMLQDGGMDTLQDDLNNIKNKNTEKWVYSIIKAILSNTGHLQHQHQHGSTNFPNLQVKDLLSYNKPGTVNMDYLTKVLLNHRLTIREWDLKLKKTKLDIKAKQIAKLQVNTQLAANEKEEAQVQANAREAQVQANTRAAEEPPDNWNDGSENEEAGGVGYKNNTHKKTKKKTKKK